MKNNVSVYFRRAGYPHPGTGRRLRAGRDPQAWAPERGQKRFKNPPEKNPRLVDWAEIPYLYEDN